MKGPAAVFGSDSHADAFRQNLLMHGILPIIPPSLNRRLPERPDYRCYRDRNRIERMYGKLKQQHRIVTRYDNTSRSFAGLLNLAAASIRLKSLVNTAEYRKGRTPKSLPCPWINCSVES